MLRRAARGVQPVYCVVQFVCIAPCVASNHLLSCGSTSNGVPDVLEMNR
jgi:hypothetical protein